MYYIVLPFEGLQSLYQIMYTYCIPTVRLSLEDAGPHDFHNRNCIMQVWLNEVFS